MLHLTNCACKPLLKQIALNSLIWCKVNSCFGELPQITELLNTVQGKLQECLHGSGWEEQNCCFLCQSPFSSCYKDVKPSSLHAFRWDENKTQLVKRNLVVSWVNTLIWLSNCRTACPNTGSKWEDSVRRTGDGGNLCWQQCAHSLADAEHGAASQDWDSKW